MCFVIKRLKLACHLMSMFWSKKEEVHFQTNFAYLDKLKTLIASGCQWFQSKKEKVHLQTNFTHLDFLKTLTASVFQKRLDIFWKFPKYLPLGGPTSRLVVDILGSRKIDIDCTNFTWVFPLQKKAALGLFLASSKMECVTFLEGFTTECISLY